MKPRTAMTLIEVLVSLMIFTVVGGAMVTILLISTDLYRRGEFGRSANDESIAVLTTLDQDLDRMVPRSAGGWLYANVADESGDCVIAFTIRADETVRVDLGGAATQQVVDDQGGGARQIVVWWTTVQGNERQLRRQALPWDGRTDLQISGGIYESVRVFAESGKVRGITVPVTGPGLSTAGAFPATLVTRGCIHLGAWLSFDGTDTAYPRRADMLSWETKSIADGTTLDGNGNPVPKFKSVPNDQAVPKKFNGDPYDSDPETPPTTPIPWPQAIRLSVGLTGGGKFAPQGRVISDSGSIVRVTGLGGQIPTDGTALVRIGPDPIATTGEWLICKAVRGTALECDADQRGARRSKQAVHARGELVEVGRQFSLVRSLGR